MGSITYHEQSCTVRQVCVVFVSCLTCYIWIGPAFVKVNWNHQMVHGPLPLAARGEKKIQQGRFIYEELVSLSPLCTGRVS